MRTQAVGAGVAVLGPQSTRAQTKMGWRMPAWTTLWKRFCELRREVLVDAADEHGIPALPTLEVDEAVLLRAQRGDHAAFREIVDQYEGRLRVLAYHLLHDAEQMNDALQDTFVKAYRALPGFRAEAAVGTWLHQICYRTCLDYLRRRSLHPAPQEIGEHLADPTDEAARLVLRDEVAAALGGLPVEQRAVLILVDRDGYDYDSVAEVLAVPRGTVASRLSAARTAMRRALRPGEVGDSAGADDRGTR
jgi:RNA polymerase sigma-70 factor (ECF subfamily)